MRGGHFRRHLLLPVLGMAPSISTDGKWIAAIVEEADMTYESFFDQKFVVKRVSSDKLRRRE